jgi:hypothetical protein
MIRVIILYGRGMNSYDILVGISVEESAQLGKRELNGRIALDGS